VPPVEQVQAWRDACMQANGGVAQQATRLQKDLREKDRAIKALERELRRKEAALAETAASDQPRQKRANPNEPQASGSICIGIRVRCQTPTYELIV